MCIHIVAVGRGPALAGRPSLVTEAINYTILYSYTSNCYIIFIIIAILLIHNIIAILLYSIL